MLAGTVRLARGLQMCPQEARGIVWERQGNAWLTGHHAEDNAERDGREKRGSALLRRVDLARVWAVLHRINSSVSGRLGGEREAGA